MNFFSYFFVLFSILFNFIIVVLTYILVCNISVFGEKTCPYFSPS